MVLKLAELFCEIQWHYTMFSMTMQALGWTNVEEVCVSRYFVNSSMCPRVPTSSVMTSVGDSIASVTRCSCHQFLFVNITHSCACVHDIMLYKMPRSPGGTSGVQWATTSMRIKTMFAAFKALLYDNVRFAPFVSSLAQIINTFVPLWEARSTSA